MLSTGKYGWLKLIAVGQQFPLDLVQLVIPDAGRAEDRLAVFVAFLPDDDVAAAEVLEVVGERAERADRRVRIPPRLVFDAVPFDCPLPQQVLQVDRQFAAGPHGLVLGRLSAHILRNLQRTATTQFSFSG